ncbi:hypothetical protein [Litoribaculum gwangyangense]|uniref:CYTH domain-containing protein n=1 Tax=Litoribaculum gwangyangense TaxID=1130722 RepID=A0ABP9C0D5_9FLAO
MNDNTIKIRLYGESLQVYNLLIESDFEDHFFETAKRLNQPLEEALLDIRFFKLLKIEKFQSIEDLKRINILNSFGGLIHNGRDIIEIKKGRKRLQTFKIKDLVEQETLFPLFNVIKKLLKINLNSSLFLIEKEIGMTQEYSIHAEKLNIDELKFIIGDVEYLNSIELLLIALNFRGKKIESVKSETLITYRHCINKLNSNK